MQNVAVFINKSVLLVSVYLAITETRVQNN